MPALLCWAALCWAASSASGGDKDSEKDAPPADLPDLTESSKLPGAMPRTVSGVVYLDRNGNRRCDEGEGLEGARVTDGVGFERTGPDGRYTITIEPDPLVPYLPSRT
ncbi:MAG: peptidase associated/transthyretin-like domain-containing protein, partial [Planctomycetota bacterium]